jgi:apolipoprotein N-acyltransferase
VTYAVADLMLAGMLVLGVCVVVFFAWRYRAWLLEHKEIAAGALGVIAAAVGAVLLGRRRDTPATPTRDTTVEHAAAKKEAEQVRAAVVRHNASTEERQAVAHIEDPHEQTKALADLIKKRRKA